MLITDYQKLTRALKNHFWFSLNVAVFKDEIFIVNDNWDDKGERFIFGKGKEEKVSLRGREAARQEGNKNFDVLEMMQSLVLIYCIEYGPDETEQKELSVLFKEKNLKKSVVEFVISNELAYLEDEDKIHDLSKSLSFLSRSSITALIKEIEKQSRM